MKTTSLALAGLSCLALLGACSSQQNHSQMKKGEKSSMNEQSMKKDDKMKKDKMTDSDKKKEQASPSKLNEGKPAADFSLQGVDGKTYKLSDFKGKKVYLKFWASWCSICLSTLADSDQLAMSEGKDYMVLSVISPGHNGEKSTQDFKKWYKGLDYKHLPVLLDPDGKLLEEYGIRSYPSAAFIGSDGVVAKTHVGFMKKEQIQEELEKIK
ncbi:redoxin family protein [Streptococcus oricebi]|uniref:Thioredoxin domain-containing protein n=1 Tax=Streptococcus oricebi TaxID=1547447 RepID=A0ABS5B3V4_9STRE|nr:hypothetical protein [Streptococcus oricebi]